MLTIVGLNCSCEYLLRFAKQYGMQTISTPATWEHVRDAGYGPRSPRSLCDVSVRSSNAATLRLRRRRLSLSAFIMARTRNALKRSHDLKARVPILFHDYGYKVKEIVTILGLSKSLVYNCLKKSCSFRCRTQPPPPSRWPSPSVHP